MSRAHLAELGELVAGALRATNAAPEALAVVLHKDAERGARAHLVPRQQVFELFALFGDVEHPGPASSASSSGASAAACPVLVVLLDEVRDVELLAFAGGVLS